MATRLHYALPIARELALSARDRLRGGGLVSRLPPASDRPFIIVAGAGRSGTSAVARVLHESGVRMGTDFPPAADINPVGFYEDQDVLSVNDQMLAELGMVNLWRPGRWSWRSTVLAIGARYRGQMESVVDKPIDGCKDPRFSVTLEAWLPHLPSRPKVVVCLRSPDAFVDSTTRRYGLIDRAAARRQWARQYRRLLAVLRDYELEATCVEYDELIERPEVVVGELSEFVGRPLQAEYVEPPLRRFRHSVAKPYEDLYNEVLALNGAASTRATVLAPARERRTPAGGSAAVASPEAIDEYIGLVRSIEANVDDGKTAWTARVGMPRSAAVERPSEAALREARAANDAYASAVLEAQKRLAMANPPPGFERLHEMVQEAVNYERLIVELMRAALQHERPDQRMLRTTVRAWHRLGSEAAVRKARRRRERELQRALRGSGRASVASR